MAKKQAAQEQYTEDQQSWMDEIATDEPVTDEDTGGETSELEEAAEQLQDQHDAESAESAEPEEEPEESEESEEEQDRGKYIKKAAFNGVLKELREAREEIKSLHELKDQMRQFREYQANKQQQAQKEQQEAEEAAAPKFESDPVGYLKHENDKLRDQVQRSTQNQQQQAQLQQIMGAINGSEKAFVAQHPDYYDALEHIRNVERMKIAPLAKARGLTEQQINAHLGMQEVQAGAQLLAQGIDPATYAYQMAAAYGYKPGAAPSKPDMQAQQRKVQAARGGKPGAAPAPTGDDSISFGEFEDFLKANNSELSLK